MALKHTDEIGLGRAGRRTLCAGFGLACLALFGTSAGATSSDPLPAPALTVETAPHGGEPCQLEAETVQVWQAPEADQGVAVDERYFYAIDNSVIAKYALADGSLVAKWEDQTGRIGHLNSCYADQGLLWCANSNYPHAPMGSSVEVFDAETMEHRDSHSLGMMEEGSLTWFVPLGEGYLAAFAHYDNRGVDYKDHRYSSVVTFDKQWRRTGGWLFPPALVERMAPYAASGGALGPDGRLYVTGHDRPEMYVLEAPVAGPYLVHVATISLEIEGQAFAFAADAQPTILAVDRDKGLVRRIALPR
ncbi:hypothetical protein [Aurantiacibacter flavus]|uniref:SMP-30/Gluconolactonase/LRE-like region domain-containing protein n=1 Tax=Aurantiacibacter flavus TaxID=3145232 RepID=A0ABV0CV72_9SPHN